MKRTLLIALLAGCTTVGPEYQRPEVRLPEEFPSKGIEAGPELARDWWTLYGDATLNELIASAHASNADLRIAAA